jgi:hypothetical protein
VERRRELAKKFPGDISELIAIAAKAKKRPKVLPSAPPVDDAAEQSSPEVAVDEDLRLVHLAGQPVDDHRHRVAGVIDEQLVAADMGLAHRDREWLQIHIDF